MLAKLEKVFQIMERLGYLPTTQSVEEFKNQNCDIVLFVYRYKHTKVIALDMKKYDLISSDCITQKEQLKIICRLWKGIMENESKRNN